MKAATQTTRCIICHGAGVVLSFAQIPGEQIAYDPCYECTGEGKVEIPHKHHRQLETAIDNYYRDDRHTKDFDEDI